MTIKEIRATGVKISLCRRFICWLGNHQVVIHLYRHLRISDSDVPDINIVISNATVQQAHLGRIVSMRSALQLPQGWLRSFEQRIVGMVPNVGGKLKGAVYSILKKCCHSRRMDVLNAYIH
jgi:hypothetical protein